MSLVAFVTSLLARVIACVGKTKGPWDRASHSLASSSYESTSTLLSRLLSFTRVILCFGP